MDFGLSSSVVFGPQSLSGRHSLSVPTHSGFQTHKVVIELYNERGPNLVNHKDPLCCFDFLCAYLTEAGGGRGVGLLSSVEETLLIAEITSYGLITRFN